MSKDNEQGLSTADFAAAAGRREDMPMQERRMGQDMQDMQPMHQQQGMQQQGMQQPMHEEQAGMQAGQHHEALAALFTPEVAQDFRSRWDSVQIGFVDDPRAAVQKADELVAQVMKSLAESFAAQRASIEAELGQDGQGSTEGMRMALRSYRSFFQRLLSL